MEQLILNKAAQMALNNYLNNWLSFRVKNSDVVGISVAIRYKQHEVFSSAYGLNDVGTSETLDTNHVFEIASQTKMFTSLAVLLLHQRSMLNMFDPVSKYFPFLQNLYNDHFKRITLHDLLTHQSQLPRDFISESSDSESALLDTLKSEGLAHKPSYSNIGFHLTALVIEMVSGKTYEEFVSAEIIHPLGMANTTTNPVINTANSYGYSLNNQRNAIPVFSHHFVKGAMGFWSTPSDMCKFAAAHFYATQNSWTLELKKLQHAVQWGPIPESGYTEFALGLESRWIGRKRFLGHSGGANGHTSATYFRPEDDIAISVNLNSRDVETLEHISNGLVSAIYYFATNCSAEVPQNHKRFQGRFSGVISLIDVLATSTGLAFVDPLDWNPFRNLKELKVVDDKTAQVKGNDFHFGSARMHYSFDSNGKASEISFGIQRLFPHVD